jgi:uncharacterized protein
MERTAMKDLEAWAASPRRKPLIVGGARQVGKTWLVKEFGRTHYDAVAHIVFQDNEVMKRVFDGTLDPERLLTAIGTYTATNPSDGKTLVFLDEIQECPRAITSLKMFCEERPDVPIVAAGSLLGVAQNRSTENDERISWPVGKVDYLDLHPMTFAEFLMALGEGRYADLLKAETLDLACAMAEHYDDLLKLYFYVGGMPEAVQAYCDSRLLAESRKVQLRLLRDYELDFSKHVVTPVDTERIRETWRSVPTQISRESGAGKFMYSKIKTGARGRDYKDAVLWLADAGLVTKVNRISKPGIPLRTYEDEGSYKLFMLDVGLMGAALNLSSDTILEGSELFTQGKGALAEQYVCQQLVASNRCVPYYWSADGSKQKGEVDFLYECEGDVIPLEVKSDQNVHSRSLARFAKEYGIKRSQRLSVKGYEDLGWLVNIPLFAADMLPARI